MKILQTICSQLTALGVPNPRVTDNEDCVVKFTFDGNDEYIQVTSYEKRSMFLLSWAVMGRRKASRFLEFYKFVEFDHFDLPEELREVFDQCDRKYHFRVSTSTALKHQRVIPAGAYWHLVLLQRTVLEDEPVRKALKAFWVRRQLLRAKGAPVDGELAAYEGQIRKDFVVHRKREASLRRAKLAAAFEENDGRLVCEVPGCGFDFAKRYGELGLGYAEVHHLRPLEQAGHGGTRTRLKDLVVVCANCHRMIHRGGNCRPAKDLLAARN